MGIDAWAKHGIEAIMGLLPADGAICDPWKTYAEENDLALVVVEKGIHYVDYERTFTGERSGTTIRIHLGAQAEVSADAPWLGDGTVCAYSDPALLDHQHHANKVVGDDQTIEFGDAKFDARFSLREKHTPLAETLLSPEVRELLLKFGWGIVLDYDNGKLVVRWSKEHVSSISVDDACEIVVAACEKKLPAPTPYR